MCAQFHPSEDLIVSASLDQSVRVWDISGKSYWLEILRAAGLCFLNFLRNFYPSLVLYCRKIFQCLSFSLTV